MELKCWEIKIIKTLLSEDETERRKVKFPARLYHKYGHPVFVVDNEKDVCYCTKCYFSKWVIVVSSSIVDSWKEEASLWHEVGHIELEEGHKEDFSEWHGLDCHESQVARTDEVAADWNSVVRHGCGKELMQILQQAAVADLRDGVVTDCLDRVRRIRKYLKTGDWDAGAEHPVVRSLTRRITRAISIYMRCRQTRLLGNLLGYFWIKWNIA